MEVFLRYGGFLILLIWIFLLFLNFKTLSVVRKVSGRSFFSLIFSLRSVKSEQNLPADLQEALARHKGNSIRIFIIWIVSILIFVTGIFILGISTN